MSNLYKEALIDAKKLKEIAEEDAKRRILEEISPFIKQAISEQINNTPNGNFFIEDAVGDPEINPSDDQNTLDVTGLDNAQKGGLGDSAPSAPLSVKGQGNVMSAGMPDAEGRIPVNFEDLWTDDGEVDQVFDSPQDLDTVPNDSTGLEMPSTEIQDSGDMVDLEQEPTKENFENALHEASRKIDNGFYTESLTELGKENLKAKLFNLLEQLDVLKEKGILNSKEVNKNEKKLDFLFLKLKESKLSNSYIENKDYQRDNNMKSLKEYAAILFEEEGAPSAAAGDKNKLNHKSTMSDDHAKKQSGVSPEIGGPKDLKAASEKVNAKTPSEKAWDEAEPELKEEVEAKGSAGFGDASESPDVEFDVDEDELKEAIRSLKTENAKPFETKVEKDKGWENAEPEEKDPSHKNLKEGFGDDEDLDADPMLPAGDDVGTDLDAPMPGMDMDDEAVEPDLVLNIELPDEIEAALANIDVSAMDDINVELANVNIGSGGDELGGDDDMELDFGDSDESAELPDDDMSGELPGEEDDDEMKESYKQMKEAVVKLLKHKKILEAKLAKLETERNAIKESASKDRTALKEANLFVAKNVYFTKFLQNGNLSKQNLTKIVEYLDRAESVSDAKKIYSKIKAKLAESAHASKKLAGSPSQVTAPGSAKTLKESATHQQDDAGTIDSNRWATLAGIKTSR